MMSHHRASSERPRASRWPWLLLAVTVLLQAFSCSSWKRLSKVEGGPFLLARDGPKAALRALPLTAGAEEAVKGLVGSIEVLAVGDFDARRAPLAHFYGVDRAGPGSTLPAALARTGVAYRLRDSQGTERVVTPPLGRLEPPVVGRWCRRPMLQQVVGVFYLAIGILLWLRRSEDPSTPIMVFICACATLNMQVFIGLRGISQVLDPMRFSIIGVWAAAAGQLALVFTGQGHHQGLRRLVRGAWVIGSLLTLSVFGLSLYTRFVAPDSPMLRYPVLATGIFAVLSLGLSGYLIGRAARDARVLALRRRAKLLGFAVLCGFGWPSMSLVLAPLGVDGEWVFGVNLFCFATFPLIIGYAVLRHRLFDLRIVLRRGLIYGLLTSGVSVAYLGLVVLVAKLAKQGPSPLFLAVSVAGAVVLFGLLQARVQRAVDRFVYRARYVYGEAIARASADLSHDRNEEAIRETLRSALTDAMQLRRAYFAIWTDRRARDTLRCWPLTEAEAAQEAAEGGVEYHSLPERFSPDFAEPLMRAFATGVLVTTYDATAVAQLSRGEHENLDLHSEAGFWVAHGLEAIVPLTLGGEASSGKVLGLLLLGGKRDGRRLDDEDLAMLQTLANQISVAIESANAFAEIQRLNEGLERTVAERTAELERALDELKQMQGQLIETETQAVLGRVVAGIVHEVNTPLGGLRSGADTLSKVIDRVQPVLAAEAKNSPTSEQRRALRALSRGRDLTALLEQSGERIGAVLGSLQRFVSLDEAEVKPHDLRQGLEDVLTLLGPRLPSTIRVETQLPEQPLIVSCQPARLNRAFLNVLENAIGAIKGEGRIKIAARCGGRDTFEVLVEDSGCGIPAAHRGKLFEVDLAAKGDGRVGLRLGLPSSKRWVEEIGGTLRIESEVGHGTRVIFLLPAATARTRRAAEDSGLDRA